VRVTSVPNLVQVPFACPGDDEQMTETSARVEPHPADSVAAERLGDALYVTRAGRSRRVVADLEDAAFRRYLPLARTLAHTAGGETPDADRTATEQLGFRPGAGCGMRGCRRS